MSRVRAHGAGERETTIERVRMHADGERGVPRPCRPAARDRHRPVRSRDRLRAAIVFIVYNGISINLRSNVPIPHQGIRPGLGIWPARHTRAKIEPSEAETLY